MSNIEKAFDFFIKEFGGTFVSDLVGKKQNLKNADYIFEKYNVIAELKCLEEDKMTNPKFIEKASNIYMDALKKGGTKTILFGKCMLTSEDFSSEYREPLIKLYEEPIRNAIKKANKQIKDTKMFLNKNQFDGVLLLINSGNFALDPAHVLHLIDRILSRGLYSSINYAIFLTVNLTAEHPLQKQPYIVWASLYGRKNNNENFQNFENALIISWQKHLEYNFGFNIPFQNVEKHFFTSLKNKKS
jgi:hypothetical protein